MARDLVSVLITTHNEAHVLPHCLEALNKQEYPELEVVIIDNASTDSTGEILRPLERTHRVFFNPTNVGFAAAQNQAMRHARGEWTLALNPDVILSPTFIAELVAAAESHPSVGTVCGKLLRWVPGESPAFTRVIDSTGMYFLRNLRHLDRGAEEVDTGQYDRPAYVFGSTGAAALYRRRMVEDISVMGEFFDEDFFGYREDADVAWRAQLLGWSCIYTPRAVGWHVRRVTPSRFKELPLWINWHSVKNRFLMRVKNISWPLYLRLFLPVTWRDSMILAYSLLVDRRLLSALHYIWDHRHETRGKRQWIQSRRRVSDRELAQWFSNSPVSFALERPQEGCRPPANGRAGQ